MSPIQKLAANNAVSWCREGQQHLLAALYCISTISHALLVHQSRPYSTYSTHKQYHINTKTKHKKQECYHYYCCCTVLLLYTCLPPPPLSVDLPVSAKPMLLPSWQRLSLQRSPRHGPVAEWSGACDVRKGKKSLRESIIAHVFPDAAHQRLRSDQYRARKANELAKNGGTV